MATSVTLPALGESVTKGTVTRWLKSVGDEVAVDEALLEISTDKVDTEIPSPVAGTLLEIKADEDATVEVGEELALVGDEGESTGGSATDDQAEAGQEQAQPAAEEPQQEQPQQAGTEEAGTEQAASSQQETSGASSAGERTPVTLPALGESVTEGTVTRWLKSVGDEVAVDEALLEISTDKVDTEIPSPVAGTLLEISVSGDETVEVGAELAFIGTGDSGGGTDQAQAPSAPQQEAPETEAPAPPEEEEQAEAARREEREQPVEQPAAQPEEQAAPAPSGRATTSSEAPYVTPLVRKLAKQHDVDLSSLTGSGVGGRIRKQDGRAATEQTPEQQQAAPAETAEEQVEVSPLRGTTEKMSRMRKVIATRMVESLHTSAQLTTVVE